MTKQTVKNNDSIQSENMGIQPGEVIIGELVGLDNIGRPEVIFASMNKENALVAMTTQEVKQKHIGRQVALLFANGEASQPVIVGLIHDPLSDMLENFSVPTIKDEGDTPFPEIALAETDLPQITRDDEDKVIVDGKRVTIQGAEEITLKCGKASITLTKTGKILLRGTYLSNRSSGVNRILGGSVQIN